VKILAVADREDRALADHFDPRRWAGIDLIVSCGDLKPEYLDYLVSCLNVPLVYVRGNHDTTYDSHHMGGCQNLHGRVVRVQGLRIAGLEGSRWYGGRGIEYGDRAMAMRAWLLSMKIRLSRGVDVIVTHAPPSFPPSADGLPDPSHRGVGAPREPDLVHAGFDSLQTLVRRHAPRALLHGHTHLDYGRARRERQLGATRVIDCYGAFQVEV
jgi:Icc-related predicted phosphoesterase